jgi:hypothetical protein
MITVGIFAFLTVVWRIRNRVFTRAEVALLSLIVVNWIVIWAQINIADGVAFPEKRYWIQSYVLLCGWAVWGIERLITVLVRKNQAFKFVLPVLFVGLIIFDCMMVLRTHIPVGRRYAYYKACAWAEDVIRKDWQGSERDLNNPFSIKEYHRPNRPVVRAFSQRLVYNLKGRRDNVGIFGDVDMPDYIVIDTGKMNSKKNRRPGNGYEKISEAVFVSNKFELYKRKEKMVQ